MTIIQIIVVQPNGLSLASKILDMLYSQNMAQMIDTCEPPKPHVVWIKVHDLARKKWVVKS